VTKDADFLTLAPPPPLLLVNTGNMQNRVLLALFDRQFSQKADALAKGDLIVEIG
jgi:predicted nuclease of predicted toxin-antitoxin system